MQPSASGAERAEMCPPSYALPRVLGTSSEYAEQGNVVHDFIVRAQQGDRDEALARIEDSDHQRFCAAIPLDALPKGGRFELAMAWDPETDTARVLGVNIGRAYVEHGLKPHEVAATADLAGVSGQIGIVVDWKSGWQHLGNPKLSRQLRVLALCVARVFGVDEVLVAFWYLRDDGTFHEETATFNALELADIADWLRGVLEGVAKARALVAAGGMPDVRQGSWCRYCDAFDHCPAKVALVKALAPADELEARLGKLMPEQAGIAWERVAEAEAVLKRVKEALKQYAARTPIPTPGGQVVKQVDWPDTEVVAEVAHEVIGERFGWDVADQAAPRSTSLAQVKRVLTTIAMAKGQKLAPLLREVTKEIEQHEGIKKTTKPQVREVKVEAA